MLMNNKIKKLLSIFLSFSLSLSIIGVSASANEAKSFDDIEYHWAKNDIEFLHRAGIVSGVSDTEFMPDAFIDRAQYISMMVRALNIEPDKFSINYSDVFPKLDWYAGYLGGAVNAGLIENSMNAFNPTATISRGDAAKIMYNAVEYNDLNSELAVTEAAYSDVSADDTELYNAVSTLSSLGLMVGTSQTEFAPSGTLTRAEAAVIVKRIAIASSSVESVALAVDDVETGAATTTDEGIILNGNFSYAAFENVEFHYGITKISADVSTLTAGLKLEVWIDSMDTLIGTKIGEIIVETISDGFVEASANISTTYGAHKVYIRNISNGSATIKNVTFATDEIVIDLPKYSKAEKAKKSASGITNLKWLGYVNYGSVNFGAGYDTIEVTMTGSSKDQLIEIQLDGEKRSLIHTLDAGEDGVKIEMPISGAKGTKMLSIVPLCDVDGTITSVRFYNRPGKADVLLTADAAVMDLSLSKSTDYTGENQTEPLADGDIIMYENVNFDDGYNILAMRMRDFGLEQSSVTVNAGEARQATLLGMYAQDDDAYIEVRLDSPDGQLVGVLKENPIPVASEYDTQTCYLYNTSGIHDLYLKVVGNIGWNMCYVKLQERGYYDSPIYSLEAEEMTVNKGIVTDPLDINRYRTHTVESESTGKANVKIIEEGGYVEFTVPEWFTGTTDRTALTVRHSIPDKFDERNYSVGQKGKMTVTLNGEPLMFRDSYTEQTSDHLTLSNEYVIGYGSVQHAGASGLVKSDYASNFYSDAIGIIEGTIKPGDIIRLIPEITEDVNFCYIDCVDLENIPEISEKPASFLSITECGAIPNDGQDDAEAFRAAIEAVRNDSYTYAGIWIPQGQFDMIKYEDHGLAADFTGLRLAGAGIRYGKFQNYDIYPEWNAAYYASGNTMMHNFMLQGNSKQRNFGQDGMGTSTIAVAGKPGDGSNVITEVWCTHWNAGFWLENASGTYYKIRNTNLWADGINVHGESSSGVIYEKFYNRSAGDDALAIFSVSEEESNIVRNVDIKHNSCIATWWASGIAVWGGQDIVIHNNLTTDNGFSSGIGLRGWGFVCPGPKNILIKNNRIERCGNWNSGNQYNAAMEIVPGEHSDYYDASYENLTFEGNECIDNPVLFMRTSSHPTAEEIKGVYVNYNYIRNTMLGYPEDKWLMNYRTESVRGQYSYFYNVFEGECSEFNHKNTTQVVDTLIGNLPYNWTD